MVQPYFEYCSLVWGNCCDSLKEKLQKLQNRAARVITGDSYDTRSKDILQKLNWKNLSERRQQKTIAYVSKAIAGNCPENISTKFEKSDSERYDQRNNNKFYLYQNPEQILWFVPLGMLLLRFGTKITNLSDYGLNFLFLIFIILDIFDNTRRNEKQPF